MAQLNIYVPDKIEAVIRREAQSRGESISAYLTELIKTQLSPSEWPADFFTQVAGSLQEEFPEIERELPQEVDLHELSS